MRPEVFLDSAYAIALASPADLFHERAVQLADELNAAGTRLLTTRAVVLEIANSMSRQRYRRAAVKLLDSLEADTQVEIIPLSEQLCQRAWKLYRERLDKEWSLTDCISFSVMEDRVLSEALTTDEHFQQAGFQAMLR